MKNQQGMTLIELMVAVGISIYLINAVLNVFSASSNTIKMNESVTVMQENARSALQALSHDIRTAGFSGCDTAVTTSNLIRNISSKDDWIQSEKSVQGITNTDAKAKVDASALSEAIIIHRLSEGSVFNISDHNIVTNTFKTAAGTHSDFTNGVPVGIVKNDCLQKTLAVASAVSNREIIVNTGTSGRFSNCQTQMKGNFRCYGGSIVEGNISFKNGSIRLLESATYFIKKEGSKDVLYRKTMQNSNLEKIAENIEQIKFYYGIDGSGLNYISEYISAGSKPFDHDDWNKVVAVRMHILVRSETELADYDIGYHFDGTDYSGSDKYNRNEYVLTVGIRN